MSIWDDFKKGLKGDKEYQAAKAKKKASRKVKAKNQRAKLDALRKKTKAVKTPSSKVSKAKEEVKPNLTKPKPKVPKAKKEAANKSWKKATASAKKAGGPSINTLVKARGMHKKGSNEYNQIQNKINEHYGSKVKHKVSKAPKKSSGVGRLDRDKVAGKVEDKRPIVVTAKTDARPKKEKKPTVHKTITPSKSEGLGGKQKAKTQGISKSKHDKKKKISDDATKRHEQMLEQEGMTTSSIKDGEKTYKAKSEYQKGVDRAKKITEDARKALAATQKKEGGGMIDRPQYGSGGKVEGGGLFNFPTKDSRKR